MTSENKNVLDAIGWRLVRALQENARLTYAELGRQVGLSPPAVAERVRRLEEAGVITGYHANVNHEKVGLLLTAYIRLIGTPKIEYLKVNALARTLPEIIECHHVAGSDSFLLKVSVASPAHLDALLHRLGAFGETATSIILSSPAQKHVLEHEPGT